MEKSLEMNGSRDRLVPFPPSTDSYDANDNTRRALRPQQPELIALTAHNTLYDGNYTPWLYEFSFQPHASIL